MKIDLNAVLDLVNPASIELTLNKKDYALKRMTIADVAAFEKLGEAQPGDDDEELAVDCRCFKHAATLFVGDAPPPLLVDLMTIGDAEERGDARRKALAIYAVIRRVFSEQRSKTVALAAEETSRQMATARAMRSLG